jgi:ethanolaminephosphotransferase
MLTDKKLARERAANPKTFITQRLSSDSLFHIATHKYQGGEYTPVDYLMNPFWLWCSQCIPNTLLKKGTKGDGSDDFVNSTIAPNLVTLIGLMFNIFGYMLISVETNFNLKGEIRPWVNIACGITLFLYQTLDAMDGKHARRTRNGSPLGQLFDHGCDALSTPICGIILSTTMQIGSNVTAIYVLVGSQIPFFIAQLAESRTGTLQHSMGGIFGVTEAQLLTIFTHIASAFLPMSFWTTSIGTLDVIGMPHVEVQPNTLYVFGLILPSGIYMVVSTMLTSASDFRMYLELLGVFLPACILTYSCHVVNPKLMTLYPHYVIFIYALSLVYATTQRIVLNMGRGKFSFIQKNLLTVTFALYFMPEVMNFLSQNIGGSLFENLTELTFIKYLLIQTILCYMTWVSGVIVEICSVLDIKCFIPIQHKLDGKRL